MLGTAMETLEFVTDREGRRWEYQLLRAGGIELGRLRLQLKRLAAEGWELDGAFGGADGLSGAPESGSLDSGELHVWLRRPLAAQSQLSAIFAAAA